MVGRADRRWGGVVRLLTLRDLRHRARRFSVVLVAMSVVLTLVYLMSGLVEQFEQEPFLTVDAIGAESWVVPAGSSGPFTSSATLPGDVVDALVGDDLAPLVVARGTMTGAGEPGEVLVVGQASWGGDDPRLVEGRPAAATDELVVDRTGGVAVGDDVQLGSRRFRVTGLSQDTTLLAGLPVVFIPIEGAREALFGGAPVVSALVSDTPAAALAAPLPSGTALLSGSDVATDALGPLENAVSSVGLIRGLLWAVAGIIVAGVLYLTVLEREREFAVLKAPGGTDGQLLWSLTLQAVAVSGLAVVIATGLQWAVAPVFPLTVRVPTSAYWQVPSLGIVLAVLATRIGSARVRSSDPVQAFGAGT